MSRQTWFRFVERSKSRASFFPVLRAVERLGGARLEALRYRLCLRGAKV